MMEMVEIQEEWLLENSPQVESEPEYGDDATEM